MTLPAFSLIKHFNIILCTIRDFYELNPRKKITLVKQTQNDLEKRDIN